VSNLSRRLNIFQILFIFTILAFVSSLSVLEGSGRDLDYIENLTRFLGKFFPPDLSVARDTADALMETAQIAVVSTCFAVVLSLPLALASARNIAPLWLVSGMRFIQNVIRTIPSLIWALLAVAIVGANPLAGVVALTFYSLGYLGKFFSDAFESSDMSVMTGLRAIGAGRIQAFQFGLWPQAKPLIWSHGLWMLEYNLRSASIIGYVGAGGLGVQLYAYQEYHQ
jgi:phosphonate transport system permease protein